MPVENVAAQFAPRVQSPMDVQNALAQGALAQGQLQQNALAVQQARNVMQQRAGLAQAMQGGQVDLANPQHQAQLAAQFPDVAPGMLKTLNEGTQSAAKAKLDMSQAAKADAEVPGITLKQATDRTAALAARWGSVKNPQDVVPLYQQAVKDGLMKPEDAIAEIQKVPTDATFGDYAKAQFVKGQTLAQQMDAQQKQLEEQGRNQRNAANIKKDYGVASMHEAGQNSRSAATLAKDFKVAGIDPQTGNFVGGGEGGSSLVDLVGTGKMTMSTALSRMPPGQKERFSADLQQRYPNFDPTALATQTAAAKAFTTGKEGALLRSIGTANKHLDMLDGLVGALGNGDVQIVNKAKNAFKEQFGSEAPTNFDAAKDIVGQEVVKAIVANGGSMQERTEAAQTISKAKSPDQLRGVIKTYKTIMSAQHESLLQQRDAAGLPRSTMPDYTEQKPAAPSGFKYIGPVK